MRRLRHSTSQSQGDKKFGALKARVSPAIVWGSADVRENMQKSPEMCKFRRFFVIGQTYAHKGTHTRARTRANTYTHARAQTHTHTHTHTLQ